MKCLTGEILFLLMRNRGITKHTRRDTVIENTVKYIQQNYMHDIRLSAVAGEASVSAEHLSRIFKQNTGFGFSEYITLVRLQRAEYMLKNLFEGTIIVVSHNPSFVEQIGISRMLLLPSGRIENYSRELLEYYYELNTPDEEKY